MKLSQSNFNLRSPDCFLVRSYLIATVKNKYIFVKEFLISTKFKPKRIEHLQDQEVTLPELYFSNNLNDLILD